ncbi:hypothetical protein KUTeg_017594 [Tegillarca granosa]|uniref:Carboxylesterase type B domain-containing protein n=1 Tax=Tegillarca granosa TaxID=220873 RepID=A0ABQ9EFD1_TEGGR|nr:hypothetical protein KUTeg_017594 [Tegillarca granosa]
MARIGSNRELIIVETWEDAEDPQPWQGVLDATSGKPQCYQSPCLFPIDCKAEMSEDCLYLNIYAPLDAGPDTKKAVMVFIHGGSFTSGVSDGPIYSAENLASLGDVIIVTINYRLGN